MLKLPPNRRLSILLTLVIILILISWSHLVLLIKILSVYPLWSILSNDCVLSLQRDNFDSSFERYPIKQWSAEWPPLPSSSSYHLGSPNSTHTGDISPDGNRNRLASHPPSDLLLLSNGSFATPYGSSSSSALHPDPILSTPDLVPPILHHILLGMNRATIPASWESSRNSCLELHPASENYTHHFWDDESAHRFMSDHYPFFLRDFQSYRHTIQRADALRYFVLHHYGGIFLDFDLQCKRSLGPLRKFPIININAFPVGVSNGFMMASPHHPFLGQLITSLKTYDRSWFGIPYLDIMFSTGPMFLSSEHLRFNGFASSPRRDQLRILGGPQHRLHGKASTPIFNHLGASSWHQADAHLINNIKDRFKNQSSLIEVWIGIILLVLLTFIGVRRLKSRNSTTTFLEQDLHTHNVRRKKVWILKLSPQPMMMIMDGLILWRFGLGKTKKKRSTAVHLTHNDEEEGLIDSDDCFGEGYERIEMVEEYGSSTEGESETDELTSEASKPRADQTVVVVVDPQAWKSVSSAHRSNSDPSQEDQERKKKSF